MNAVIDPREPFICWACTRERTGDRIAAGGVLICAACNNLEPCPVVLASSLTSESDDGLACPLTLEAASPADAPEVSGDACVAAPAPEAPAPAQLQLTPERAEQLRLACLEASSALSKVASQLRAAIETHAPAGSPELDAAERGLR